MNEDFEDQLTNAGSAVEYTATAIADIARKMPTGRSRRLTERAAGLLESVVELLKLAREETSEIAEVRS